MMNYDRCMGSAEPREVIISQYERSESEYRAIGVIGVKRENGSEESEKMESLSEKLDFFVPFGSD